MDKNLETVIGVNLVEGIFRVRDVDFYNSSAMNDRLQEFLNTCMGIKQEEAFFVDYEQIVSLSREVNERRSEISDLLKIPLQDFSDVLEAIASRKKVDLLLVHPNHLVPEKNALKPVSINKFWRETVQMRMKVFYAMRDQEGWQRIRSQARSTS